MKSSKSKVAENGNAQVKYSYLKNQQYIILVLTHESSSFSVRIVPLNLWLHIATWFIIISLPSHQIVQEMFY